MYENITYAELKSLPKAQKPDAWRELKSLYTTQKELAEKLGVSPNIVYNMISKYAGTEKKASKLEIVEAPKRRRGRGRARKQEASAVSETRPVPAVEAEVFSISVNKVVSGDDAQYILNGIGGTLIKARSYSIEVKICER